MKVIDLTLLDKVSSEAKESPRLRMNYNFHQSLEDKCHRMLNAVEPGTMVPIHKHPTKDESFVILRGKVRVTTHNDDGSIIEDVVLSQESGNYGVDIPKNVWHKLEALESGSVIFECKEGPFVPHEVEGILEVKGVREFEQNGLQLGHFEIYYATESYREKMTETIASMEMQGNLLDVYMINPDYYFKVTGYVGELFHSVRAWWELSGMKQDEMEGEK